MSRARTELRCGECGAAAPKWVGRCPLCGAWGSLVEAAERGSAASAPGPVPLADVALDPDGVRSTGVGELDRVLGGGLVPGSVTLLGGEPGIGKSTLVLQALAAMTAAGSTGLLVSAEESAAQVRARAGRIGPLDSRLLVFAETSLDSIVATLAATRPALCVVDSIQTVGDPAVPSSPGSIAQVRTCAGVLARVARDVGSAVILVGHVTKDGGLAGPRALEHLVDTVLSFEGDRHHALRLLRAVKHRYGATGEVGLFEMTDAGMAGVVDPSGFFLGDRRAGVAGSAVVATVEGRRPLLVEVQALVGRATAPTARRAAQGVDAGRLGLLLAVLERRVGIGVGAGDVFVSAVGGARLVEPAADLGIALALVSAATGHVLPSDLVAVGEVGLAGEVRQVPHLGWRLGEAARLGFGTALVGERAPTDSGLAVVGVRTLLDALDHVGLLADVAPPAFARPPTRRPARGGAATLARWRPG